jgi:magnesium chelatase family protein
MSCAVQTGTLLGVEGVPVTAEVTLVRRLPGMVIVGLADSAVQESRERVRSALQHVGFEFPRKRVVINLAPANLRKIGTTFDLPIAVGVLAATEQVPSDTLADTVFVGELSLQGEVRRVRGALPLALLARESGARRIVLSIDDAAEAAAVPGLTVLGARDLEEVAGWMDGTRTIAPPAPRTDLRESPPLDLAEVRGQHRVRRALEVAAAGGHNLLMVGAPGCGKTMLSARLPGILPSLSAEEAVDITRVYSAAGLLERGQGLIRHRPFRAPHHSISASGMVGSARLTPGELSLAHHGVLFLDEIAEFRRDVLEQLRGPLEDRKIRLVRAAGTVELPAAISLVAASNPCKCGYAGHPTRACRCTEAQVNRYRSRLSGPLMDRMDLHVWVQPVDTSALVEGPRGEPSAAVRSRVEAARARQRARSPDAGGGCNAALTGDAIREAARPTAAAKRALEAVLECHGLSARAWARILKVARTLADLDGADRVGEDHVLEASSYRVPDRAEGGP